MSWAAPASKRILVSESATETGLVAVVDQLADFGYGLARHDHGRQVRRPFGQRRVGAGEPVTVGGDGAQARDAFLVLRLMQVDAVEIVAGFLGRDGEAGLVDQAPQMVPRQLEGMGQIVVGHHRKLVDGEAREPEARAPRDHVELPAVAPVEIHRDLRAVRQLAHDVEEGERGRGHGTFLLDRCIGLVDHGEVHVRRGEPQAVGALRIDPNVGENGDRVAPLDDALHMRQGAQKRGAFDREFHARRGP